MLGECPNGRGAKTSTSRAHRPRVDVKAQNEHGVSELELFFMAGYDCTYEEFEDFGDHGSFVLLAMKSSRLSRKRAMILWR